MAGNASSRPSRRLIDAPAKARFLAALRSGAHRSAAAEEAGFTLAGLYTARRRDPAFRLAWIWALELSAGDEAAARDADRRASAAEEDAAPVRIAPQGGRLLQRRRMRWVRFTEERRQVFLNRFAGGADACAAAEAAGVSYATVYLHRRRDPHFRERWDEALRMGYARLEAEVVRERLEAQQRLREDIAPAGEVEQEFDRTMKLLARWDRRGGGIGPREVRPGHRKSMPFDQAIEALAKRLRSLGLDPFAALPPPATGLDTPGARIADQPGEARVGGSGG